MNYGENPRSVQGNNTKPKSRVLDTDQCFTLADSEIGTVCLRNPNSVRKSSKDPNRGLYPQNRKRHRRNMDENPVNWGVENWSQSDSFPNNEKSPSVDFPDESQWQGTNWEAIDDNDFCAGENDEKDKSDLTTKMFEEFITTSQIVSAKASSFKSAKDLYTQQPNNISSFKSAKDLYTQQPDISSSFKLAKDLSESHSQQSELNSVAANCFFTAKKNSRSPAQNNNLYNYYKPIPKFNVSNTASNNESKTNIGSNGKRSSNAVNKNEIESADDDVIVLESRCKVPKLSGSGIQQPKRSTQGFKDRYGLCGSGKFPKQTEKICFAASFEDIPNECLELIFAHVPMIDLSINLTRVCHRWNDVISHATFMPWKKLYHKVKVNMDDRYVANECDSNQMNSSENCLIGLIKYMKKFHPVTFGILEALRNHSLFIAATAVINERVPDINLEDIKCAWSVVTQLCIMTETVNEITSILKALLHSCPVPSILNGFYCILSFLFYFKKVFKINPGFHYRLYYALYLYENKSVVTSSSIEIQSGSGQQSIFRYGNKDLRLKLTNEQARIVNHDLKPGQHIKIIALAGTGKTTTLVRFAEMRPNKRFLNIMFNKSVSEHAKKIFPANVTIRTIHSLAWKQFGFKYKHKLTSKVNAYNIIKYMTSPGDKMRSAGIVLKIVTNFLNSAESVITTEHVPEVGKDKETLLNLTLQEKNAMINDAVIILEMMCDQSNTEVRATHDLYLKLFQLSRPKLEGYDCLFVDEAQDCNAAMIDIIMNQNFPCIIVGDPHQQIYSFRGAVSALNRMHCTHTYYLTQSFRFGPEIAYVASCALEIMKGVHQKTLVGGDKPSYIDGSREGQLAVIARSNAGLFQEAVQRCCQNNIKPPKGAYAGGIRDYGFDQIVDIYRLWANAATNTSVLPITDRFIKRFKSFTDLNDYAKKVKDVELLGKISIVTTYTNMIPEYVDKIKKHCNNQIELAEVVFSTVHKSKGLEFDTVYLARDCNVVDFTYNSNYGFSYVNAQPDSDEANILYVAITRAKKRLILSPCAYLMLQLAQEKFEFVKPCPNTDDFNEPIVCLRCEEMQDSTKLKQAILVRRRIELSTGELIQGGFFCFKCATLPVFKPRWPNEYCGIDRINWQFPNRITDHAHKSLASFVGPLPGENEDVELSDSEIDDNLLIYIF